MKTIVSDLDGTLLNKESKVASYTKNILNTSHVNKIIATGRSYKTVLPLFEDVSIDYYVLLNGAECRDNQGNILYKENISSTTASNIMKHLLENSIDFEVNTEQEDYSTDTAFCPASKPLLKDQIHTLKEIRKIFIFLEDKEKIKSIKEWLNGIENIYVTSSSWWNIEITSSHANKALMVERVLTLIQVPKEETYVCGDGYNDMTLFKKFTHTRAMENGVPELKRIAEKVIESNENHGVALEIQRIEEK